MAIYVGETVRLATKGTNLDAATALTSVQVSSAVIQIFNGSGTLIQTANMSYDSTNLEWFYDWSTGGGTPQSAGSYRAKFMLSGVAFTAFDFLRFRLRQPPVG